MSVESDTMPEEPKDPIVLAMKKLAAAIMRSYGIDASKVEDLRGFEKDPSIRIIIPNKNKTSDVKTHLKTFFFNSSTVPNTLMDAERFKSDMAAKRTAN